jgi:hypothetical protein
MGCYTIPTSGSHLEPVPPIGLSSSLHSSSLSAVGPHSEPSHLPASLPPLPCLSHRPTAARPHRSRGLLASGPSLHRATCHVQPGPHLLPPRGAPSRDPPLPPSPFSSWPSQIAPPWTHPLPLRLAPPRPHVPRPVLQWQSLILRRSRAQPHRAASARFSTPRRALLRLASRSRRRCSANRCLR